MLTVEDKNFDFKNIALSDCIKGNAMDAAVTLKLFYFLEEKLKDHSVWNLLEGVIIPSVSEFACIEYDGMLIDEAELASLSRTLNNNIIDIEDRIAVMDKILDQDNVSSGKDLIEILYTREGAFELYPPDRTEKGAPATDKETLNLLLTQINQELLNRGKMGQ